MDILTKEKRSNFADNVINSHICIRHSILSFKQNQTTKQIISILRYPMFFKYNFLLNIRSYIQLYREIYKIF